MGAEWIPAQIGLAFASHGARSLFEDITTVQFIHRSLAFVFLICVGFMWLSARRYSLRTDQRVGIAACVSLTAAQFGLGVLTLIQGVPIVLGVLHQLGALAVFTALIFLLHRLRGVCGELSN